MGRVNDYRELAQRLKPYITPWIVAQGNSQAASSAVSGMSAHALDGAYHTGTLAQSQAPWAVTDDEFATHTGNPDAHHARATATAPLVVTGQDVSLTLGHGVETSSNALRVKLPTNSGLVRDSTGVYLSPATVGPATTNSVTGSGHTHTVDASSNPGASAKILKTAADGSITLQSLTVNEGFTAAATAFRVINHTHDYPHTHVVVNPGVSWTLDEQFGVDIDDNLLVRGYIVGKHAIQLPGALLIAHYDGPEPYATNYKGEGTGHLGQVPLLTGGVVFRPGKFQKGLQSAESTTNLVTNPSFETNTTGWSAYGGASISRSATHAYYGSYSLACTTSAANQGAEYTASGLTAFAGHVVSAWVRVAAACNVMLHVTDNIDLDHGTTTLAVAANTWTRITRTITTDAHTSIAFQVYCSVATTMYVDAVQVERKDYTTPYCDGSLGGYNASGVADGTGHNWSGTVHASTSSRNQAQILYYVTNQDIYHQSAGTVMCWLQLANAASVSRGLFVSTDNGGLAIVAGSSGLDISRKNTEAVLTGSQTWVADTWYHIAVTWSGRAVTAYINAVDKGTATATGDFTVPGGFWVGRWASDTYHANGVIDDLVILDRAASADEIRAVYESNAPVFAETSTWHWRSGRNRVWADAEGLWMLGASGSAVLGAYAGDDANPSATKSWGGATLSEGDVVIGHNQSGSAAMVWDKSAGKFQFVGNGSGTAQAEIDTQGRVSAGGGKIVLGQYGARLSLGSSRTTYLSTTDGARIIWSAAEIYEALEEEYTYLSTSYYRRSLVARTVTGFGTNVSHTEIAALHETTSGSGSYRGPRIILESGGHLEDYTTTYGVDDVVIVVADMLDIQAAKVLISDSSLGGQLTVSQGSTTGAKPPLIVGQSDVSEEMIRFNGTVATGNTINTDALGAYYGRVRVSVNGTAKWIALYS